MIYCKITGGEVSPHLEHDMTSKLFSPYRIGDLELKNRVAMAPMTRCRATADHTPTEIMADYYGARASGGLLITEGTSPSPNGTGYARIPGIWSEAQVEGWKPVTKAVHDAGGKIALQLMHTGRVSHQLNMPEGATVLAPSAVPLPGKMYTDQQGPQEHTEPVAMTEAQIEETIQSYVTAAENAIAAGFDMIELHGANGYLLEQFLSPAVNQREDAWGGSSEKRAKFVLEVARRSAEAIGASKVGIRLSPHGVFNGITPWENLEQDYTWLAKKLGELGLGYIHLVDHSAMGAPPVPESTKAAIKEAFGGTIILAGGYFRNTAEEDLDADKGDLIAFGRPYIANPDLVERMEKGVGLNTPDQSTFYTPGAEGYLDYPTLEQ